MKLNISLQKLERSVTLKLKPISYRKIILIHKLRYRIAVTLIIVLGILCIYF